jgi:Na+/H+ antiporter NhaA
MTSGLIRSALAAVAGFILAWVLILIFQYAGGNLSPAEYDPETGEILIPIGSTIALIVGWFIGTFAGSWLAMRVSGGNGAGWIVAGAVIGAAVYRGITLDDAWWIMALAVLLPVAAAWIAQRATGLASPATA